MKKTGLILLCLLATRPCWADFALYMYEGDSFRAGAGKSSTADNAAVVFNNPGALIALPSHSVLIEGQYYDSRVTFTNTGSTDAIGNPLSGGNGGDGGVSQFVPSVYYADKADEHWSYGVALNVPFGLSVKWPDNWVGRYQVTETGISTVNINPAVAYRLNEHVAIGVGISAQYANAKLANAIDFGAVCFAFLDPTTQCVPAGLTPQAADGKVTVKGDDWGYGYNIGLYLTPAQDTHIGLSYRSKIDYKLHGTADFTIPSSATVFNPAFTDTHVSVPLTLPEMFSAGVSHAISPAVLLSADATWTRWSRLKSFDFAFDNPAQPPVSITRNWKDTWRYALGIAYRKNSQWTWQGGIAYAQSAIPNETLDPAIPISNAWWYSAGFLYTLSVNTTIGAGINHIQFADRTMDRTGLYGDTVIGPLRPKLDVYSVQLKWTY
jgi:long-chain fatty acid transport protein